MASRQGFWTLAAFLASSGLTISGYAADTSDEILRSYQSAHQARSIDSIAKLVHFRTKDPASRTSWLKDVSATFSSTVASISLVEFREFAFMLPEAERNRLPATLRPSNWLLVEFASAKSDSDRTESMSYLIGVENGKYFIVGP